jgi:hypothetical protein
MKNVLSFLLLAFPALYALTCNRKRKMYEELLNTIISLATDRQKILHVKTIVSDYEEAWLLAVERIVSNAIL